MNNKKPVLGLFPPSCLQMYRLRLDDINESIARYKKAGKAIPDTWLSEKELIIKIIKIPIRGNE